MSYCLIYVTTATKKEAYLISKKLLEQRLVACVNVLGKIDSFYWWKGKIEKGTEFVFIAKTRKSHFVRARNLIKKHHSYGTPAILQLPISRGDEAYMKWLKYETR